MNRFFRRVVASCLVACACLLVPVQAVALNPVPMVHNGVEGDWFSAEESAKILHRIKQLEAEVAKRDVAIEKQDELLRAQRLVIRTSTSTIKSLEDLNLRLELKADQLRTAVEAVEPRPYEPIMWIGVGAAAAALVGLLIMQGTSNDVTVVR